MSLHNIFNPIKGDRVESSDRLKFLVILLIRENLTIKFNAAPFFSPAVRTLVNKKPLATIRRYEAGCVRVAGW